MIYSINDGGVQTRVQLWRRAYGFLDEVVWIDCSLVTRSLVRTFKYSNHDLVYQ